MGLIQASSYVMRKHISVMFSVLAIARLLAAANTPVQDCDEVYNFWEPTHFVTEGWALQTWEWSPEYAIRSWAYVAPHALVITVGKALGFQGPQLFWLLRGVLALISAFAEYKLARVLSRRNGATTAYLYIIMSVPAAGLFHASVSYLPSSFAMYCTTLGAALFLDSPERNVVQYLGFAALGGLLGWPFALFTALPWSIWYLSTCRSLQRFGAAMAKTVVVAGTILAVVVAIDSVVYKRLAIVPLNIVAYNVLDASEDAGPEIFGTEPWYFYAANLALNFNAMLGLAAAAVFVVDLRTLFGVLAPLFSWFILFSSLPHKEERFMYVVYPLIPAAAAVFIGKLWTKKYLRVLICLGVAAISIVSAARCAALTSYYTAPYSIYEGTSANSTVCIGREWYRFPSSYFLESQLRFVPSGFDGLLPGEFVAPPAVPTGMNSHNIPDPSKLVDVDTCDYLIELAIPVNPEAGEVDPMEMGWVAESCGTFLDPEHSTGIARLLYFGRDSSPLGTAYRVPYCRFARPVSRSQA